MERSGGSPEGGSFGGSVSALRLPGEGFKGPGLREGQRFSKEEFAENNRDIQRVLGCPPVRAPRIFPVS